MCACVYKYISGMSAELKFLGVVLHIHIYIYIYIYLFIYISIYIYIRIIYEVILFKNIYEVICIINLKNTLLKGFTRGDPWVALSREAKFKQDAKPRSIYSARTEWVD